MAILKSAISRHYTQMRNQGICFLLFVCALSQFLGCQPAADSAVNTPAAEIKDNTIQIDERYDHSPIVEINNTIIVDKGLQRKLPKVNEAQITYCESVNGEAGQYSGVLDLKKYPLASLSKVILTAWALQVLGPEYRFETTWSLKKVSDGDSQSDGVYDAYLKSNYDPIMNIEKMFYMLNVLKSKGVKRIRNLVIDETTRVFLSVLNNPHFSNYDAPVSVNKSVENLQIILNSKNWGPQSMEARNNLNQYAFQKNMVLTIPDFFSVDKVEYLESSKIDQSKYDQQVKVKSATLSKYLKEINVNSNNYMSDTLFNILGGTVKFKQFQTKILKINENDLSMLTGSGLPVTQISLRSDNKGTCISVLKTLKFLKLLAVQLNLNLGHVLLNPQQDDGTFTSESQFSFNNSVVLKTGRLLEVTALNLAGMAQLKSDLSGDRTLYFSYLAHDFNNENESEIKNIRDSFVQSFMNYFPLKSSFASSQLDRIFF
jgi:serine-type D-Ala-D-Ala carboxypeptidase/endopeptidase (penicillin-binding protein 4)